MLFLLFWVVDWALVPVDPLPHRPGVYHTHVQTHTYTHTCRVRASRCPPTLSTSISHLHPFTLQSKEPRTVEGVLALEGREGTVGVCVCLWAGIDRWLALVGNIGPLCTIYREREPLWVLLALGHFLNDPGLSLGLQWP